MTDGPRETKPEIPGAALRMGFPQAIYRMCAIGFGTCLLLIALSFMYACVAVVLDSNLIGPPKTLFIGLFGCFCFLLTGFGTALISGDVP